MKKTPPGQKSASRDEPITTSKQRGQSVSPPPAAPNAVSPTPTQARMASYDRPSMSNSRPPPGKGRRRMRNPLSEPPEEDAAPEAEPAAVADAAMDEAALVGDVPIPPREDTSGESPPPSPRADGADSEQRLAALSTAQSKLSLTDEERVPLSPALKTNIVLLLVSLIPLTVVIILAALQGGLVEERVRRSAQREPLDEICTNHGLALAQRIQEEAVAGEDLLVFHIASGSGAMALGTSVNTSTPAYASARSAFAEAGKATDLCIDALTRSWERNRHKLRPTTVRAFEDASAGAASKPWATRRGYALHYARRVDGAGTPSAVPVRAFDLDALLAVRRLVFSGGSAFPVTAAYNALARVMASVCATSMLRVYGARTGDTATLGALGAIVSAQGAGLVSIAAGASQLHNTVASVRYSSARLAQLHDAAGTRAAVRTWPVQTPALGAESPGAQAAVPAAIVGDVNDPRYAIDVSNLRATAVAALRTEQRTMLGRLASFKDAATRTEDSTVAGLVAARVALWTALALVGAMSVVAACFVVFEMLNRDRDAALDRDLGALDDTVSRMRAVVARVKALKLGVIAAVRRRVRIPRPEELQLYTALSNMKDIEQFLPSTVSDAPRNTPLPAFNGDGLNVRPKLHVLQQVCVLRVDVSHHHRHFGESDDKKQAVHHQLTRFISAVDEAAVSVVPTATVQNFGAYSLVLLNLAESVDFPASLALLAAVEISRRAQEVFAFKPHVAIAMADLTIGNVGALTAAPRAAALATLDGLSAGDDAGPATLAAIPVPAKGSSKNSAAAAAAQRAVKAFTTFGPANDEAAVLAAVGKLHNAGVVCSQAIAHRMSQELAEYKALHGHHHGNAFDGSVAPPVRCAERVFLRALELVSSQRGGGGGEPRRTAAAPPAQRAQPPPAQLCFEVLHFHPTPPSEAVVAAVKEWNRIMRAYCAGQLRQTEAMLASVKERAARPGSAVTGLSSSAKRMTLLVAVATQLHGPGDLARPSVPYVTSYAEVMKSALIECT
jgi:hypothetical protein